MACRTCCYEQSIQTWNGGSVTINDPNIDRNDTFAAAVTSLLETNKIKLGLEDVWVGDQERLPRTPCAAVEPGPKTRTYNGVPRRFEVMLEAYILVYVERIQDTQQNVRQSLALAEEIEAVLHEDETVGGLVISSYVSDSTPGYVNRSGTLLSVVRLTFQARSQRRLPYPGA